MFEKMCWVSCTKGNRPRKILNKTQKKNPNLHVVRPSHSVVNLPPLFQILRPLISPTTKKVKLALSRFLPLSLTAAPKSSHQPHTSSPLSYLLSLTNLSTSSLTRPFSMLIFGQQQNPSSLVCYQSHTWPNTNKTHNNSLALKQICHESNPNRIRSYPSPPQNKQEWTEQQAYSQNKQELSN